MLLNRDIDYSFLVVMLYYEAKFGNEDYRKKVA
jgi:hypothetical protein